MPPVTFTRLPIEVTARSEVLAAAQSDAFKVAVKNASDDNPAEILVYGEIGMPADWGGVTATDVARFLRDNKGKPVNVKINSPGGLAYDGVTIHNALISHDAKVTTTIEGIAGSAASIIAMAGMPVRCFENASLFIHRALALVIGNCDVMRDTADFLDKLDDGISRTYGAKAGKPRAQFLSLMKGKVDGTVLTAQEAQKLGLVDEVLSIGSGERGASAEGGVVPEAALAAAGTNLQAEGRERLQNIEAERARRLRERR